MAIVTPLFLAAIRAVTGIEWGHAKADVIVLATCPRVPKHAGKRTVLALRAAVLITLCVTIFLAERAFIIP
jgi:hypothetical protein